MKVELSAEACARVERLVRDGVYPSVESAGEAALEQLQSDDWEGIDSDALARQERETRANGTLRDANEACVAEMRAKTRAVIG